MSIDGHRVWPVCRDIVPLHECHAPRRSESSRLFARARRVLPGGVDSPVRAFGAVGGEPPFIERARGARIRDVDGRTYIDYVMSWGPLIHGHAPADLTRALRSAAGRGTSFGAPTAQEVELGRLVCRLVPSVERVRFVNSGTEATMSAIRVARAATGRERIIQVRGVLPRSRRRVPRAGRLGRDDPRGADQPRRRARDGGRHADCGLQRRRIGRTPLPRAARRGRRGDRRADRRQHGRRTAGHGLSGGAAHIVRPPRKPADLRRGHLRLPGGEGRRAGGLRRTAGSDLPRQDHRRRAARRGLRRARRPDGAGRAGRARLPGRHAVRQPARDDRGDLGALELV